MKIVAGLGNPGEQFQNSKHNTGFIILDTFAAKNNLTWHSDSKSKSEIIKINDVLLVKPQTFMNNSGSSVSYLLNYFNTQPEQLLIIHDDVDLEFGKIKKQFDSGAAGHHGVLDIIEKLGTQRFWRYRVGVGRPNNNNYDVEDWVLTKFSKQELEFISSIEPSFDF
ncbi:MAG TPA: aminoacyl-tRNA hydrolase [Candidatus Saccharimonadales bacterium]|nr:aminoacyl-tRNA hydrolase [Candidatus Saccharimonadales bacterium]